MATDKWMQGAVKRPGALTRKAKGSGESPMEFAREHYHSPGLTGQQARFAVNAQKGRGGGMAKNKGQVMTSDRKNRLASMLSNRNQTERDNTPLMQAVSKARGKKASKY